MFWLGAMTTPATRVVSVAALRPFSGRSFTRLLVDHLGQRAGGGVDLRRSGVDVDDLDWSFRLSGSR